MKDLNLTKIIIIVFAIIVLFFVFKKDKQKREIEQLAALQSQYSDVKYYISESYFADYCKKNKIQPTTYLKLKGIDGTYIIEVADNIKKAKGIFNDDEEYLYNVIASIPNRVILSMIAFRFKMKYGVTLLSFLQSFLNTKELKKILSIVKSMKKA